MKRLYCFLILSSFLCLVSCKKFLSPEPVSFTSPLANYSTGEQLLSALAGVYDVLGYNRGELYADRWFKQLNSCTDESYYGSSRTTGAQVFNFDYTNVDINGSWQALYIGIERANNLIAYIDGPASMDPAERQAILGEALFLRGYYYFLLVSNWGDVPLRTEPTTLTGVTTNNVPGTPAREIYDQILADMTAAEEKCYPITHFDHSSRVSKTTVQGMLARVCLTMAGHPILDESKYADALRWAGLVKSSGIHSLNPSYSQIFINAAQDVYDIKESMWEADFYGNGSLDIHLESGRLGNTNGIPTENRDTGYAYGYIYATAKLYKLYGENDLRRDWAIAPYKYVNDVRVPHGPVLYDRNWGKWRRSYETLLPKDKNFSGNNFPILRYADVLLMLAEAENHVNGPTPTAYGAFNEVRRRAYGLPLDVPSAEADLTPGLTQTEFQDAIVDERSRELCFEALRRPDLIRWGIWMSTMADLAVEMDHDLSSNASLKWASQGAKNASTESRYLLWPIPSSEMSVNRAIKQNPGY